VTTAKDQFAGALRDVAAAGASSTRRTARPDDLRLEVRDVGPIMFPVAVRQAKQLCLVGRPARFGKGEQTLLDRGVRDTWEIPRSRIKIDKRQWDRTLRPTLDGIRADLGLPPGCVLTAEFHAMLVYGPGQFFAPHQDSEKADTMIGTLVVTLPSDSQGGTLVVKHGGESVTYRSSKTSLSFVAFYADCRHEVRPITLGYRVALTYNLLLGGDTTGSVAAWVDPAMTQRLADCLDQHFTTRPPARYGTDDHDPPNRLVYLLDHEYTERGLSWARLKGSDADRASAVRAAAEAADCETVLALAEVHETWEAYDEPEPSWHRRRYGWDDDDDSGSSADPELQDLIDSTVHLDRWLNDPDAAATPTSLSISDDEVCATTPSVSLEPYASEYEGYMGNYGNTMDRWYRRAALVVWPRRLAFAVRAEASPEWALDTLAKQIRARDVAGAREGLATVARFWRSSVGAVQRGGLLTKALRVARNLDDPDLATMLLAPFRVETLARSHAALAVGLVAAYGEGWARSLVGTWFGDDARRTMTGDTDRRAWLDSLPSLCTALCAQSGDGRTMAALVVTRSWPQLRDQADRWAHGSMPSPRAEALGELGPPIAAVLAAAAVCEAADLREEIVAFLNQDHDDLLPCAMAALQAGAPHPQAQAQQASGLDAIARHCAIRLAARLARPTRAADDWSITPPIGCGCELCATLATFLRDPARLSYDWPLAEPGRRHIHQRIDMAELPVRHQTRRQGRPYTLVLTKTDAVFTRERQQRERDAADLAWLNTNYPARAQTAKARRPRTRI
jgi:hypothetical protein